jgi:hypothetical protein
MGHSCDKELTRRSNDKLEEALARAARAEEQLAPRNITKEQFDKLQELKGQVSSVIMTTPSDFESTRFAAQIGQALNSAGIDVKVAPQRIGMIWSELYIVVPERVPDFGKVPLYKAFFKAGFSVGCGDRSHVPMRDLPTDIAVIMVGVKKSRSQGIPFAWTLDVPLPRQDSE